MLQETTVSLRLEPLTMLLLYKASELNTKNAAVLRDAFAYYGFKHRQLIDSTYENRLADMAERYSEILLCHEIAEAREEAPGWKDLLAQAGDRKAEQYLRAVKDLLADTSEYGPYKKIIDTRDLGALSLTIALMEGYRKTLFPELKAAYAEFSRHEDWSVIDKARRNGYERFKAQRNGVVDIFRSSYGKEDFIGKLKNLLQRNV
jgi:hypothetical protein